jgi:hypothetical protein
LASTTVWTATGAWFTFQYAILTDSTTSTNVAYWDYGSSQAVASGETVTVTLDGTNGVFQATWLRLTSLFTHNTALFQMLCICQMITG